MIPADVAGMMFAAYPVSGARGELVTDANPGLAEAVVGGLVTQDHFIINKHSFKLKSSVLVSEKSLRQISPHKKSGGREQLEHVRESLRSHYLLTRDTRLVLFHT